MAQILAIAYNTGPQIEGTLQYGVLAVSNSNRNYSNNYGGVTWWATPDLSQRYVICYPDPSGTHPTPFEGVFANLGFWGTSTKTDEEFLNLCNKIPPRLNQPNFTSVIEANDWLFNNGYWSSYIDNSGNRAPSRALELCYIYTPCEEGEDYILIQEDNAQDFPIGKWFDGNCYRNSGVTTYSNEYTFLSGNSFLSCENCLSDCILGEALIQVDCKLYTVVTEVPRPTQTPTPTPTNNKLCLDPTVDIFSCDLGEDVTEILFNVRLQACCKNYEYQSNYIISRNLIFLGIVPVVGNVIIYNSICYEIMVVNVVNATANIEVDPNQISFMIGGATPCRTCTQYYKECDDTVTPTPTSSSTPTPTPSSTERFVDTVGVRLKNCCDDRYITTDVNTTVTLIPNNSVIQINGVCYLVVDVFNYSGGVTINVDESNHYSDPSDPCKICESEYPCDVRPEQSPTPTPTPTQTPTQTLPVVDPVMFTARACCGGYQGLELINLLLPNDYVYQEGYGFIYEGYCYEIISENIVSTLLVEVSLPDLKSNICLEPGCCPTPTATATATATPTPTYTPTQTLTPTPTPTRLVPPIDCTPLDVVFIIDNTASMANSIEGVKSSVLDITNYIEVASEGNYRLGLVIFDENDSNSSGSYIAYESSDLYNDLPTEQKYVVAGDLNQQIIITNYVQLSLNNNTEFTNIINSLNGNGIPLGWGAGDSEPSDVAIDLVANQSFAGEFGLNHGKIIILITDSLPSGTDDQTTSVDFDNIMSMVPNFLNEDIRLVAMMYNSAQAWNDYYLLSSEQNPYIQFTQDTNGLFVNSHEPQQIINSINDLCGDGQSPT